MPGVFQGGFCQAVKLILVLHTAGKPGGTLPPWWAIGAPATPVSILSPCFPEPLSPGALYLLCQALFPPQGLLWLVSSLSHIMAGVCFCSAAQKLLEVSVYKQRDVWDHIWIQQQTPGVVYTDYGDDFVLFPPCPLAQYPSCSVFSTKLKLSPPLQLSLVSLPAGTQAKPSLTGQICTD